MAGRWGAPRTPRPTPSSSCSSTAARCCGRSTSSGRPSASPPIRRSTRSCPTSRCATSRAARSAASLNRTQQGLRTKNPDTRQRAGPRAGKTEKAESRSFPIIEEAVLDEEEEALREAKSAEEARRREKEKRARETEKTKEEERKQVALRHEEMQNKAHTFDQEGNIIWVEELKVERLPKVQEAAGYQIKKDKNRTMEDTMRSTAQSSKQDSPTAKDAAGATKRRGRGQAKGGRGQTGKVTA